MTLMPSYKKPRFSIVIPAYNEETYIGNTLDSLQKQDFAGTFETIVVDNNCTDRTTEIVKSYKKVTLIAEKRPGVCWARQAGTEAARGEIIISTDADTTFSSDWLTNIDRQFRKSDKIVAVCGGCQFVNAPWWGRIYPKLLFGAVYGFSLLFKKPFYITATNTAFKKSAWDGYDMEQTQGGDELGLLHKLRNRGEVKFTNKYVVYTSSRRLEHGLWYNLFVTCLYYYLTAYYVNRLFNRRIIGTAPAYRQNAMSKKGSEIVAKVAKALPNRSAWTITFNSKPTELTQEVARNIVEKN